MISCTLSFLCFSCFSWLLWLQPSARAKSCGRILDAQSGNMTWPAYTCMNTKCDAQGKDGRPFLLVHKLDASVGAEGRVVLSQAAGLNILAPPTCPACNSNKWTGAYEPPEIAERRVLLEAELAASRAARRKAKHAATAMPDDHRTPAEIMYEISKLPKLYPLAE